MADFSTDVNQLRQQLQAALEQAQQWQRQYEAQTPQRQALEPSPNLPAQPQLTAALPPSQNLTPEMIRAEVMEITEVGDLQEQLLMARFEILRLTQALTQEQLSHARTRQNLTNALADAVESIGRLKHQLPPKSP